MVNIDNTLKTVLVRLYEKLTMTTEVTVSAPEYEKTQIDALINEEVIEAIDVSTLSGWGYIIKPTYKGEALIKQIKERPITKLYELIHRGEEIGKMEYHTSVNGINDSRVRGPMFNVWMDEINIFNERFLKDHPLHNSIFSTYFHKKNRTSTYDDMMGHLRALSSDEEFIGDYYEEKQDMRTKARYSDLEQMLQEDVERCREYLNNPQNEQDGVDLYIEITSRYDSVIPNFGQGLYQCVPDQHWYDPEISGESLLLNLKSLMNKMISYQAVNYQTYKSNAYVAERKTVGNKVFIVHGHDDAAIQEMARTLEKGGFEAVILREQPDNGLTIIEKIEQNADVDFAVVLYTECDLGRAKEADVNDEKYRARQNVVFEHGYLIGKLGRNHVCALVKGNVETPGDISGVLYVNMDSAGAWKMQLGKNMKAVGLPVDLNTFCG